jgi:hypothetical protein
VKYEGYRGDRRQVSVDPAASATIAEPPQT